jgi:hypothetical protein
VRTLKVEVWELVDYNVIDGAKYQVVADLYFNAQTGDYISDNMPFFKRVFNNKKTYVVKVHRNAKHTIQALKEEKMSHQMAGFLLNKYSEVASATDLKKFLKK